MMDRRLLEDDAVLQISFVTHHLDKTVEWFTELTGKAPSHVGAAAGPAEAKARYRGEPAEVSCRLAIFKFANIDLEFLEPGPEKSVWRDALEQKGHGVHHIAFRTRNMTESTAYLTSKGVERLQMAEFFGAHGRYAYFDTTEHLGVQLELLEYNNDMEPQAAPEPGSG
jgi:catechol 2,3-dioxygenase-like lactoylglutathione lyase family enzyme